jgi:hypothetical protein
MCSTAGRLTRICRAIEELAGQPAAGRGGGAADDMAVRLAAIWTMIAEADPELARRVAGYLDAAE